MAHSYVSYGGNHVHMHDLEIILTAFSIVRFAEAHPAQYPLATYPYLAGWRDMLEVYAPGCLDLALDEHLATTDDVDRFCDLVQATKADLAEQGETIPAARLNQVVDAPALFEFGDRPTRKMLADLDQLLAIVTTSRASQT